MKTKQLRYGGPTPSPWSLILCNFRFLSEKDGKETSIDDAHEAILSIPLFTWGTFFQRLRSESHGKNYVANYPKKETSVSKRRELLEGTRNLTAMLASNASILPSLEVITEVFARSSGSFPALTTTKKRLPPLLPPPLPLPLPLAAENNDNTNSNDYSLKSKGFTYIWLFVIIGIAVFVATLVIVATIFVCRKRAVKSIGPWKTDLSGQLQKAFVTGVPKVNRSELETTCEDCSNIIDTFDGFIVYKGTLSSGVEIAVTSTMILETKEWTRAMEKGHRKKRSFRALKKDEINQKSQILDEELNCQIKQLLLFSQGLGPQYSMKLYLKDVKIQGVSYGLIECFL